jgi:glycerol-3-phosphate acyltransferase PlsY
MTTLLLVLAAYLIGSLPFALISSRLFGLADPRTYGSGNPGATNVLRSGSKAAALLTLIGDAAKGCLAVWLVQHYGARIGADSVDVALVAVAVFLGHVFSVFLGFKGGKGVATALGVLLALSPLVTGFALGAFALSLAAFRYVSLASVVAAVVAIFAALKFLGAGDAFAAIAVMSCVLIARHAENIRRISAGTESRLGRKKP